MYNGDEGVVGIVVSSEGIGPPVTHPAFTHINGAAYLIFLGKFFDHFKHVQLTTGGLARLAGVASAGSVLPASYEAPV